MSKDTRRFSHSLTETMLDCGRKAKFRYIDNIPAPKGAALVKGTACDNAWNYALREKMDGETIDLDSLLTITEEAFRDDVHEQGGVGSVNWGDSSARAELDSALRMSKAWHKGLLPDIEPTAIQIEYHRALPSGRDFIGFVDFEGTVNGQPKVTGDNKTASRAMSQGDADKGLQPSAYAWLKNEPTTFVFARAIDTATPKSEFVWTFRSAGDVEWYGDAIAEVERQWDAGIFPPNPKSNLCSPKFCPFFERCQPHRTTTGGVSLEAALSASLKEAS